MADELRVSVRLVGLPRLANLTRPETARLVLPAGATVGQALAGVGIDEEAQVSVLVSGRIVGWYHRLADADELVVVPPIAGGQPKQEC